MCEHVQVSRVWVMEVAVIKKQSPLAVEEAIKLLQSDVICIAVLVSLTRPPSLGHLSIRDYKHPLQTSKNAFNGLVASYKCPYTLLRPYTEITAMAFVAGHFF